MAASDIDMISGLQNQILQTMQLQGSTNTIIKVTMHSELKPQIQWLLSAAIRSAGAPRNTVVLMCFFFFKYNTARAALLARSKALRKQFHEKIQNAKFLFFFFQNKGCEIICRNIECQQECLI